MSSMSPDAQAGSDDARLRGDAQRIESLLDELAGMMALPIYQRVEELVQRLLRLHGAGLERLLDIVLDNGEGSASPGAPRPVVRVCDDPVVSSLLLVHGLHPQPPEVRIRAALARLAGHSGWRIELTEVDTAGVAHLRVTSAGSPDSRAFIEASVMDAAPELSGVVVDDGGSSQLVQLDVRRSKERR